MKIIWWETFLVVFISLALIAIFCYYRLNTDISIRQDLYWKDTLNNLQTGDLLFARYDSKHGKLIKICTGQEWSHVAFVYRKNNDIFLIEIADYTAYDEPDVDLLTGLCIIKLDKWKKLNSDRLCGYRKYKGRSLNIQTIEHLVNNHQNVYLDMNLYNWTSTLFNAKNKHRRKNNYYCSEFIAHVLQELGVLDPYLDPSSYSPAKLALITNYDNLHSFYLDQY